VRLPSHGKNSMGRYVSRCHGYWLCLLCITQLVKI